MDLWVGRWMVGLAGQWIGGLVGGCVHVCVCVCACVYVHACLSNKIGDAVILCFVWYGACWCIFVLSYHILGKFGKFDELFMIRRTKTIQISICN